MKEITYPVAFAFFAYLSAIVALFYITDDPDTREKLIGLLQSLSPFFLGVAVGGTAGGTIGYFRGIRKPEGSAGS